MVTTCCPEARLTSCCVAAPGVPVVAERTEAPGMRPVVLMMSGLEGEAPATPRMLVAGRAGMVIVLEPPTAATLPVAIPVGMISRVCGAGVGVAWEAGLDTTSVGGCCGRRVMVGRTTVCCCCGVAGVVGVAGDVPVADWLGMVISCKRPSGSRTICWPVATQHLK